MQLVLVRFLASCWVTLSRRAVNISSSPSRSDAAASGWSAWSSEARRLAASRPLLASGWAKMTARRLSIVSPSSFGR